MSLKHFWTLHIHFCVASTIIISLSILHHTVKLYVENQLTCYLKCALEVVCDGFCWTVRLGVVWCDQYIISYSSTWRTNLRASKWVCIRKDDEINKLYVYVNDSATLRIYLSYFHVFQQQPLYLLFVRAYSKLSLKQKTLCMYCLAMIS